MTAPEVWREAGGPEEEEYEPTLSPAKGGAMHVADGDYLSGDESDAAPAVLASDTDSEDDGYGHGHHRRPYVPKPGVEVFVGGLTRSARREMFRIWFAHVGEITEVRIARDKRRRRCRGYGYIRFRTSEEAERAVTTMNRFQFVPGRYLGVLPSDENRTLFVGNLDESWGAAKVASLLTGTLDGLRKVEAIADKEDRTRIRGFCFVEFVSHAAAAAVLGKFGTPEPQQQQQQQQHQQQQAAAAAAAAAAAEQHHQQQKHQQQQQLLQRQRRSVSMAVAGTQTDHPQGGDDSGSASNGPVPAERSSAATVTLINGNHGIREEVAGITVLTIGGVIEGMSPPRAPTASPASTRNTAPSSVSPLGSPSWQEKPLMASAGCSPIRDGAVQTAGAPSSPLEGVSKQGAAAEESAGEGGPAAAAASDSAASDTAPVAPAPPQQLVVEGRTLKVTWADPLRYHIHLNGGIKGPAAYDAAGNSQTGRSSGGGSGSSSARNGNGVGPAAPAYKRHGMHHSRQPHHMMPASPPQHHHQHHQHHQRHWHPGTSPHENGYMHPYDAVAAAAAAAAYHHHHHHAADAVYRSVTPPPPCGHCAAAAAAAAASMMRQPPPPQAYYGWPPHGPAAETMLRHHHLHAGHLPLPLNYGAAGYLSAAAAAAGAMSAPPRHPGVEQTAMYGASPASYPGGLPRHSEMEASATAAAATARAAHLGYSSRGGSGGAGMRGSSPPPMEFAREQQQRRQELLQQQQQQQRPPRSGQIAFIDHSLQSLLLEDQMATAPLQQHQQQQLQQRQQLASRRPELGSKESSSSSTNGAAASERYRGAGSGSASNMPADAGFWPAKEQQQQQQQHSFGTNQSPSGTPGAALAASQLSRDSSGGSSWPVDDSAGKAAAAAATGVPPERLSLEQPFAAYLPATQAGVGKASAQQQRAMATPARGVPSHLLGIWGERG